MKVSVLIIAEAGVNHNGKIELAKKLIDKAKECGADIVKFQTANPTLLVTHKSQKAEYQKVNTDSKESQYEMLKKLLLPYEDFKIIKEYCDKVGIEFLSTPFELESIEYLNSLSMNYWKIPSGEITNLPYLMAIGKTKKEVILSTGMSNIEEIEAAVKVLYDNGTKKITLLHCTTEYPAPVNEVNLKAMITMREHFKLAVGYSDHTQGMEIPIAAVALGAEVIEKHLTLDRNMEGPDHKASMEPEEFKKMVKAIRNVELGLGNGEKKATYSEEKNKAVARKSIVAKIKIKKGEIFTEENLTVKRPGTGISPMKWFEVLGKKAVNDFEIDEEITI